MNESLSFDYPTLPLLVKALRAEARLSILKSLKDGPKASSAIFADLRSNGFSDMEKSTFYYHLLLLKSLGIIYEVSQIIGAGKPEKVWGLAAERIIIKLVS